VKKWASFFTIHCSIAPVHSAV